MGLRLSVIFFLALGTWAGRTNRVDSAESVDQRVLEWPHCRALGLPKPGDWVPRGSWDKTILKTTVPRKPNGHYMTFSSWLREVMGHHFCHILWANIMSPRSHQIQKKAMSFHFWMKNIQAHSEEQMDWESGSFWLLNEHWKGKSTILEPGGERLVIWTQHQPVSVLQV